MAPRDFNRRRNLRPVTGFGNAGGRQAPFDFRANANANQRAENDSVVGKPKLSKQQIARLTGQLQRLRAGNRAPGQGPQEMPQPLSNRVNRIRGMLAGRRSGTKVAGSTGGILPQPPQGPGAGGPIPFTPPPGGPKFPTGDFGGVGQKPPPPMVPPRRRKPIRGGY